jgi:hypothetical protein
VNAASTEMALEVTTDPGGAPSLGWNYLFSALEGATWYMPVFLLQDDRDADGPV